MQFYFEAEAVTVDPLPVADFNVSTEGDHDPDIGDPAHGRQRRERRPHGSAMRREFCQTRIPFTPMPTPAPYVIRLIARVRTVP